MDKIITAAAERMRESEMRLARLEKVQTPKEPGTTFPANPATNQRFFRTDRALEYYYDGTRWLTMNEYTLTMPLLYAFTAVGGTVPLTVAYGTVDRQYSIYFTSYRHLVLTGSPNDGTNYYTLSFNTFGTPYFTYNTSAFAINAYGEFTTTTFSNNPNNDLLAEITLTKTGSPGLLYIYDAKVRYRYVG